MQQHSTRPPIKQLADLPTAQGGLTRLAADRVRGAGIKLMPLLARVGLTAQQIDDPDHRIPVRSQVAFLEAAASALNDDFLGLTLAEKFDCRDLGLLYYVMASSDTLGSALKRAARYSRITNEAVVLEYREGREPILRLTYSGVPRHVDRHQIEFCIIALVRVARGLSGRPFVPERIALSHVRSNGRSKFARLLGTDVEFGSDVDEITFSAGAAEWALVDADAKLNRILVQVCEDGLAARTRTAGTFRIKVENTIAPLLPHGQGRASVVAEKLGVSERTLERRLAREGVTFSKVLQDLKANLAIRYLEEDGMPISKIAWLLGFEEVSSFSHACRRWTGRSPRQLRWAN